MSRLLIAAAALSLLASQVARADEYPPCRHKGDDKCRVVGNGGGEHHGRGHHGHHGGHHHHHHK